jgi:hypothetical protein
VGCVYVYGKESWRGELEGAMFAFVCLYVCVCVCVCVCESECALNDPSKLLAGQ